MFWGLAGVWGGAEAAVSTAVGEPRRGRGHGQLEPCEKAHRQGGLPADTYSSEVLGVGRPAVRCPRGGVLWGGLVLQRRWGTGGAESVEGLCPPGGLSVCCEPQSPSLPPRPRCLDHRLGVWGFSI